MAEISPLRRRMIEDMTVRNLSPATQRSYLHAVTKFSRYFGRSPDRLGLEEARAFQVLDLARLDRAACCDQPGRHRGKPFAVMFETPLADLPAITVREDHMMALRRPVDAGIPLFLIAHAFSSFAQTSRRDLR
jgi:hypothetical protein